jgi:hypothetical protein
LQIKPIILTGFAIITLQTSAVAQQVTIDFSEFTENTEGTVTSKGYEISGWGSMSYGWGENYIGVYAGSDAYFSAEGAVDSCGGAGCAAEAEISFERKDGGPFAVYSIDSTYPHVFSGHSAVDGSWFEVAADPLGSGQWLNVTQVNGSVWQEAFGYGATVIYLDVDDIIVAEVLNAEIDVTPYAADNNIRPNDAYFFTVGIQTLNIADGDARDFDATTIDPAQVTVGPNKAPNVANPLTTDYDGDGDLDMIFGFRMEATGINCIDPGDQLKLVATTTGGETVAGKNTATRIGCGGLQTLDFEELAPGTFPIISKGYRVTGDATLADYSGDMVVESSYCDAGPYAPGCWEWSASQAVQRTDGSPFALYNYDLNGFLGNCIGGDCGLTGTTTWGEEIRATGFYGVPLGTGGWLSLQSVVFEGNHFDTTGGYCDYCQFWIDDLVVANAVGIEIDFDPWKEANEIHPKWNYFITVQIYNTSIADGDTYDFDPATVDPVSLRLGPNGAEVSAATLTGDIDGDGDLDYIFGFRMEDTGHTCTDTTLMLTGATHTELVFAAETTVAPIGCEEPMPIDVEPYSTANRVYPNDDYQIQVAVLNTNVADGDAYNFNPSYIADDGITFGPGAAQNVMPGGHVNADVDGDGDTDRIFAFDMYDSAIACGDTEVETYSSRSVSGGDIPIPVIGIDTIQTEECDTGGCHP